MATFELSFYELQNEVPHDNGAFSVLELFPTTTPISGVDEEIPNHLKKYLILPSHHWQSVFDNSELFEGCGGGGGYSYGTPTGKFSENPIRRISSRK